jgi:Ras-related protein Rab-7A
VMLMYDVNEPETLEALTKWWHEFKDRAPLKDEDVADFCCVVVGNKTDLVPAGEFPAVMEGDALKFVEGICPPGEPEVNVPLTSPWQSPPTLDEDLVPAPTKSGSIDIADHRTRQYASREDTLGQGRGRSSVEEPYRRREPHFRSTTLLRRPYSRTTNLRGPHLRLPPAPLHLRQISTITCVRPLGQT